MLKLQAVYYNLNLINYFISEKVFCVSDYSSVANYSRIPGYFKGNFCDKAENFMLALALTLFCISCGNYERGVKNYIRFYVVYSDSLAHKI